MSLKLKVVLGVLCLVAIVMVTRVIMYFGSGITANVTTTTANTANIFASTDGTTPVIDRDHDGLPDASESQYNTDSSNADTDKDGYLDGEEVAAGCDPVIPAPGDCKNSQRKNLTKETSKILLGGIQTGDLASAASSSATLDSLALSTLSDFQSKISATTPHALATLTNPTPQDVTAYLNDITKALQVSLLMPKEQLKSELEGALTAVLTYKSDAPAKLQALADKFATTYDDLQAINVPAKASVYHAQLVDTIHTIDQSLRLLANPDDPLTQSLSIVKLKTALQTAADLNDKLKSALHSLAELLPGADDGGLGSATPGWLSCLLADCVPVHVKQDDPFKKARDEDKEERKLAREALEKLLGKFQDTIKQSGKDFKGNTVPTFVQDYRDFRSGAQDAGRRTAKLLIGEAAYGSQGDPGRATICAAYADAIGQAFGATAPSDEEAAALKKYRIDSPVEFKNQVQCTLPEDFDPERWANDPIYFSWPLYYKVLENDPLLTATKTAYQYQLQVNTAEQVAQDEIQSNNGYIGHRNPDTGQIDVPGSFYAGQAVLIPQAQLNWIMSAQTGGALNAGADPSSFVQVALQGGGFCGASSYPEQLFSDFLKANTGSDLCQFLQIIGAITDIIKSL